MLHICEGTCISKGFFLFSFQACPLNPNPQPLTGQQELLQDFSKRFSPAIRGVVEFAKRIPGFSLLAQDDQVTLLKAGVFEVLLVRLACMFDSQTSSMICLNGQVLKRDSIHNSSNARFLMDSMFDFAERMNALRLSDAEIGLFCSVVVIAADRPGLRNTELIEKMHNKLKAALQTVVNQNHHGQLHILDELMKKVPDLRTLNTLHSEKLLAFKMTEQQQMMQQQQQHHVWHSPMEEESNSKSPAGSSWSSSSDVTMDEAKSPLGSVSSTESMCSSEMTVINDYHQQPNHHISSNVTNAPLLAATLAGGLCPHRHRANSGSTSSGDDELAATSHLIHNGLTITPVSRPHSSHPRFRKLDSPSDSGIESGTEKVDKPTSVCSSPRSSVEDQHIVEDMPVLKRVLQAPPLYDTNSLMDEAYKPHKKFRALRNKDSAEAEPVVIMSPQPVQSQLQMQLNGSSVGVSAPPNAPPQSQSSLSSTHSTLAKSLMEGPRMTAEQMKRTDIIHNYIMRSGETATTASPMVTATPTACPYKTNNGLQQQHSWATSVITTTGRQPQMQTPSHTPPPSTPPQQQQQQPLHPQQQQQQQDYQQRLYLHPQSPHSTSPAPQQSRSPTTSPHSSHLVNSIPKMVELQVDIADSQQPLNLSKKSPSPSPHVVTLEV